MEISRADLKKITKEKLGAQCLRGQGSGDARSTSIVNMHKMYSQCKANGPAGKDPFA